MSRFNGDDYDPQFPNEYELYEANFQRHLRGPKGQAALRDLSDALLALPERKLINGRLADEQGHVCTVGALAVARGRKVEDLAAIAPADEYGCYDEWESEERTMDLGVAIGLNRLMAIRLASLNDDVWFSPSDETPEQRFERVLAWVEKQIESDPVAA